MALATVTYNAWDANQAVIPAALEPEVWFRPLQTSMAHGLITNREVKGSLNPSTGAGSVQLESHPNLFYVPYVTWLTRGVGDQENQARGYAEWAPFFPGSGGPISSLDPAVGFSGVLYGFGAPPSYLNKVVYLDITGPQIRVYGPPNSLVEG